MKTNETNIMVIEDDNIQRLVIVKMLRSLGVTSVLDTGNGKRALEMLHMPKDRPVDIAICDLKMPEMDGMEFLRHLGQEQHNISVIIISALDSKLLASVGKMALAYGIKLLGIIEKPILIGQLKTLISKCESLDNAQQRLIAAAPSFSLEEVLLGIRAKQFEPFFQPKIDLKSGRVTSVEALARWIHPEQGVINPYTFIPLLEQSGDIDELTFILLEKAAGACRMFHDKGYALSVSVNLSIVSLTDTAMADLITQAVRKAGGDPRDIILEITETAAMTDVAHALENLARLCMNGFALSIDDYGTGYASIQQLMRVPFSELKIDQSFVNGFYDNKVLRIVVESSIDMAHRLQVRSVAEGVETQQDLDTLKSMGCDMAQGNFIAPPMDLKSFVDYMELHRSAGPARG